MSMTELATIAGLIVLVVMVVVFLRLRRKDLVTEFMQKRKATSKLVSRADYVEGMERIPVAISLSDDTFYYENPDLEASFELGRIDEVEYGDELATGRTLDEPWRVMRLRCHGAAFEFVMDKNDCAKWMEVIPPRGMGERSTARAV
ncbi:MAG TPA: hypothetical protein VNA69_20740 [Thermoanaerobaculia bacterium]|nr:hypothetical protein [Thermoanaerobaculia bacterium]